MIDQPLVMASSVKKKLLSYLRPLSSLLSSVTTLGDLLDFGQLFKALGNN